MSTEIRLEIEERQTTEGKDYYVAQTFMLGARWLIFVYDAVKDEKSGRGFDRDSSRFDQRKRVTSSCTTCATSSPCPCS